MKIARTPASSAVKLRKHQDPATAIDQPADEDPYFSRAVGKAFGLLEILGRASGPLTLNQVAEEIELTKSSTFRLLRTLQTLHYIVQDSDNRYVIASENKLNSPTHVANQVAAIARDYMSSLNTRFQETVSVAVLYNNHIEVVEVMESSRVVRMANTVGRIIPPHASSLGKAITAFQPAAVAKKLLQSYGTPRLTPYTLVDEPAINAEMNQIRKQGYAYESEESTLDGCCFGSPIFLKPPTAVAAMSISMPKSRLVKDGDRKKLLDALREATEAVSKDLSRAIHRTNAA